MDKSTFDDLTRLFATTHSRRDMLKRLIAGAAGGAAVAAGFARGIEPAAAQQCTPNDSACTADDECCSGNCDDSGTCSAPDTTCIEDGGLCQAGIFCCSGLDCAPGGHCPSTECTPDDGDCASDGDCCSGHCDDSGSCYTPDNTCIEDGGLCQAGRYCCSGLDCAPGGHCPTSTVSTLPDTGAGSGGSSDSTSNLIVPIAALGAAAVVGARRLRSTAPDDTGA